ncbi:MAG: hypothetical protein AAGA62_06350 [Bacteroidota bacterium]
MHKALLFLLLLTGLLRAQSPAPFNADYRLPEGVYFSHAAVLAAQPDLGWEAIDGEMVQLPEDFRVQIANYGYKDVRINADIIPYAISLDGMPYLFIRHDDKRDFHEFAGLRVMGALSTIKYDTTVQVRQLMKAYNPINGQPFREAWVERTETRPLTKILHLRSGALVPFTRNSLIRLCTEDKDLTEALGRIDPKEEKLLLRALKLFDDRHPVSLPLTPSN